MLQAIKIDKEVSCDGGSVFPSCSMGSHRYKQLRVYYFIHSVRTEQVNTHNTHIKGPFFIPFIKFDLKCGNTVFLTHTILENSQSLSYEYSTRFFQTLRFRCEPALVQ